MKLLINGTEIPKSEYTDGDGLTISSVEVSTVGAKEKSVSQEFVLYGAAYQLVYDEIINDPNGLNNFLSVKIYEDTCCDTDILLFEGMIRGDDVDWCVDDCFCTVNFREHTEETRQMDCIRTTLIYDNWNNFTSQSHPRMAYCVEMRPGFLQHIIIILGIIVNLILFLWLPFAAAISLIVSAVNTIATILNGIIPGDGPFPDPFINFDGDQQTNFLQEYQNFISALNQKLIGCGRKHPSPLVSSYINNVCAKCGLNFSSTIFNNPASEYNNTVYFFAPVKIGSLSSTTTWIDGNEPNMTLDMFLDQIIIPINGDWKIINGTLYVERKDYFYSGDVWVNYEALKENNLIVGNRICMNWRQEQRPAFAQFSYTQDAIDLVGNEALLINRYKKTVEWNQPVSELQSGHLDMIFPFGAARFRGDGVEEDVLAVYEAAPFGLGTIIGQNNHVLILPHGVAALPKLIIWDGVDILHGRVEYNYTYGATGPADFLGTPAYNWPWLLNEFNCLPNTAYPTDEQEMALYGRFWSINNPKLIIDQGKQFNFTMYYNCESLQSALEAEFVQLPNGIGRITGMEVNLSDKTIKVTGDV